MIRKLRPSLHHKNVSSRMIFLIEIIPINEESSKNVLNKFCESKGIARIYGVPYSPQHQSAVKVFSWTAQNYLPHQKITKGKI